MKLARPRALAAAGIAALAVAPAAALAAPRASAPPVAVVTSNLGKVVATKDKLGLYTWASEKKAHGKILCTGTCAKAWPPVLVTGAVTAHAKGVTGMFGTVKRPDGKTQLTYDGLAVYTFSDDKANVVKCDGVQGWHAVRA